MLVTGPELLCTCVGESEEKVSKFSRRREVANVLSQLLTKIDAKSFRKHELTFVTCRSFASLRIHRIVTNSKHAALVALEGSKWAIFI